MKQAIAEALAGRGYETLTAVQEAVTRPGLEERDLLVSAQTGSGKTVGFGLAIAPTLLGPEERFGPAADPLALVIAPTRELAMQVRRELAWLYGPAGAVVASCVGGMDMRDERRALERGAHVVVATPGRLRDHIMRGSLAMDALRAVVLDEADEMLDLGFREDLEFILEAAPESRRTLMFSATVPKSIATLAQGYQKDALRIVTAQGGAQHADIAYQALSVAAHDAENAIINVLRYHEAPNALVFCNTRAMVNRLLTRFSNRGFPIVALSGELTQSERTHALQAMRDGRARVCIATDVAARGIDLPNLDLVIHADLPTNAETLLHRSGRTGRAGRKGVSVLIVPEKLRRRAEMLLRGAKVGAEWTDAPSAEAVIARDRERMLADPAWREPLTAGESEMVALLTRHFSPGELAAGYFRLWSSRISAPEELSPPRAPSAPAAPRGTFGPSVWLSVAGGRGAGAEPRRLLPMLCRAGGLSREEIGAIRVQSDESHVELLAASLDGFLERLGDAMRLEGALVKVLDTPPGAPARGRPDPAPGRDRHDTAATEGPGPAPVRSARIVESAATGPAPGRAAASRAADPASDATAVPPAADTPRGPQPPRAPRRVESAPPAPEARFAGRAGTAPDSIAGGAREAPASSALPEDVPARRIKLRHTSAQKMARKRAAAGEGKPGPAAGKPAGKSAGKSGGKAFGKPAGKAPRTAPGKFAGKAPAGSPASAGSRGRPGAGGSAPPRRRPPRAE